MNDNMFSVNNYFGKYEALIRKVIGKRLDGFKQLINQINNKCTVRVMNIGLRRSNKATYLGIEELKKCDSAFRCRTLAGLLYSNALWRLESSHLMMCIGLLNVAYANLRTSLEFLQTAYIVERCDEQALIFLEDGKETVNLQLMDELLINPEYGEHLKKLKELYSDLGIHRHLKSLQLSSLFAPNRLDKYATENTKMQVNLQLPEGLADATELCIRHGVQVGMLFLWLESLPIKKQEN